MSDAHWLWITNVCSSIGVVTTLIANCTLLTMLYLRPSKAMGSYQYLMAIFSIFSMFYTAVETFLRPIMHIYDSTVFVIQRKRFDYSSTVARAISSTYCGCYSMSFVLFAVHFIYRFFVSCK
ncbi:unnamed protein product [Caenorhabditis angaria]|uniref:G-protein coupled receptors family 1 profile domain-containing protein n=1 Tax=Caenorhabditis angaria TaxID=860376 RepID=A0A9P1ITT9_9PELO|nr:unnamed protein product [Caenorhabditis angaria]